MGWDTTNEGNQKVMRKDIKRAILVGNPSQSRGQGLGQQTGGTASSDDQEAFKIVQMVAPLMLDHNKKEDVLRALGGGPSSGRSFQFARDMCIRAAFGPSGMCTTGKQLFYLRDIKDKLVEAGLV